MRVLSIDPGYERLGIAIIEKVNRKETLVYSECFKTSAKIPHSERLALIAQKIGEILEAYKPNALAIETLLFNSNQKTALLVAEARGLIIGTVGIKGLRVFEYNPLQIKVAVTGFGHSDKDQVIFMVKKLIAVSDKVKIDDEFDAIACGLTFFASEKEFQKTFPQGN